MEPLTILRSDPLDLLFENRNKMYGAYTLRKFYTQRLYISLGVTFSTVLLISFFIYLHFHSLPVFVRPMFVGPDVHLITPPPLPETCSASGQTNRYA